MRRESRDPVRFLSKSCFGARKVTHVARMGTRYVKGCYQMRSAIKIIQWCILCWFGNPPNIHVCHLSLANSHSIIVNCVLVINRMIQLKRLYLQVQNSSRKHEN